MVSILTGCLQPVQPTYAVATSAGLDAVSILTGCPQPVRRSVSDGELALAVSTGSGETGVNLLTRLLRPI